MNCVSFKLKLIFLSQDEKSSKKQEKEAGTNDRL